jgi:sugar/nucleoside kinase (ribokinase family)
VEFEKYFNVVLGLNEKEAYEIGDVLGLPTTGKSPDALSLLALEINRRVPVNTLVIHPVSYALAAGNGVVSLVQGPFTPKPVITTGAGDHFNSGFCLGKLLGLDNGQSVLTGVTTSGHYVRTAQSPTIPDLAKMLRAWPAKSDG